MEELEASELGSKEYWDSRYVMENYNYKNHGDPGEVWFGEDIADRILTWVLKTSIISQSSKIVDIGCGNGMFLVQMASQGFADLTGVDYCDGAIKLAKSVAKENNALIQYRTCNILEGLQGTYEVIHDKGTYDAISLSADAKDNRNKYIQNVYNGLSDGGLFIITSCNWTQDELDQHFGGKFARFHVIPTPQFRFGGKTGSLVTCVIYKKTA